MEAVWILIIGVILIITLYGQGLFLLRFVHFLKSGYKNNRRAVGLVMVPHILVAFTVFLGTLAINSFGVFDGTIPLGRNAPIPFVIERSLPALIFAVLLIGKAIVGPIVSGVAISYSVYLYATHGTVKVFPLMEWAISLVFKNAGEGTAFAYTLIFLLTTVVIHGISVPEKLEWSNVS